MPIRIKLNEMKTLGQHNWERQAVRPVKKLGTVRVAGVDQTMDPQFVNGGIAEVTFVPTYGYSRDRNSALNVAAAQCYDYARSIDNSIAQYDAYEWFKYALAGNSIRVLDALIKRQFVMYDKYSARNLAIGQLMLDVLHITATDRQDIENLKAKWFELHEKAKSCHFLKEFDVATDHRYLCENIFADDCNIKTQYYLFTPQVLYVWDIDGSSPTGALLAQSTFGPSSLALNVSIATNIAILEYLLGVYTSDDDCHDIAQSNLRLTDKGSVSEMDWSDEIPEFQAIYDYKLLDQLHSANMFYPDPASNGFGQFSIDQDGINPGLITGRTNAGVMDGNILLYNMPRDTVTSQEQYLMPNGYLVFSHDDSPTAEDNIILTRFITVIGNGTRSVSSAKQCHIVEMGTEVIYRVRIYSYSYNPAGNVTNVNYSFDYQYLTTLPLSSRCIYSQWTSLPYLFEGLGNQGVFTGTCQIMTGDLDNFTLFADWELETIHRIVTRAALTSLIPLDRKNS